MNKILILIAIVLPLIYLTSCKDDPIQPVDEQVLEFVSKTDSVSGKPGLLQSEAAIKNISDKQVTVKIKMEIVSLTPGHSLLVCMGGTCYPPSLVDKLFPGEFTLWPNQVSSKTHFFADLDAGVTTGVSIIRYKFIPDGDTTKAISYTTKYKVADGF